MRLALELGKSIREIEAMPAAEFAEWEAWDRIEPIGQEYRTFRADLRAGIVAAAVANASGRYGRVFVASDFMPRRDDDQAGADQGPTVDDIRSALGV